MRYVVAALAVPALSCSHCWASRAFAWWSQLPTRAISGWCALGVFVGALILYSALPPTRRQGLP